MKPQDYSTRTRYRPPAAWYQRLNWLGVLLTSLGLAPRDAVTLQVRGRYSGKTRRIPILRTRFDGSDYLVALAGESQWVRNVRAAHGQAIIRRRRTCRVRLEELAPADRGDIIAAYLRAGGERSGTKAQRGTGPLLLRPGTAGHTRRHRGRRRLLPGVPRPLRHLA